MESSSEANGDRLECFQKGPVLFAIVTSLIGGLAIIIIVWISYSEIDNYIISAVWNLTIIFNAYCIILLLRYLKVPVLIIDNNGVTELSLHGLKFQFQWQEIERLTYGHVLGEPNASSGLCVRFRNKFPVGGLLFKYLKIRKRIVDKKYYTRVDLSHLSNTKEDIIQFISRYSEVTPEYHQVIKV